MQPEIIDAAVKLAKQVGYLNITRSRLAQALNKSDPWLTKQGVSIQEVVGWLREHADLLMIEPGEPTAETRNGRNWIEHNKAAILEAAYAQAETLGINRIKRDDVARSAGVAQGTVNGRFGSMDSLRRAVVELARERGNSRLVAQGEACGF